MHNTRIVIATQGFVFIGTADEQPHNLRLTNAYCIRKWGTTAGLGEIALNGPTKETILDYAGVVDFPISSVVAQIHCVHEIEAPAPKGKKAKP